MDRALVSFITVNHKMAHSIRHLLQSVQDAQLSFPFEFFLVDNASADEVVDMVRSRFPWVQTIESSLNLGFGGGNNLGLERASGEFVMLLNPDLTILPGELEKWVEWMQAHPDVGISSPRLVNPDGTDQDSCYRFPRLLTPVYRRTALGRLPWVKQAMDYYLMKDINRSQEQPVDWVLGAAMLIRRSLLERIGFFDERFFMYFEDADLCRRAWTAGMSVMYTPVARLTHYHQRQSRTRYVWQAFTNPLTRMHIASGVKYFLKHYGQPDPRGE